MTMSALLRWPCESKDVSSCGAMTEAAAAVQGTPLVDGYAPFCKHVFVPNFPGCSPTSLLITEENQQFLQSAYLRRRPEELAVLSRYSPLDLQTENHRLTRAGGLEDTGLHAGGFLQTKLALCALQNTLMSYCTLGSKSRRSP